MKVNFKRGWFAPDGSRYRKGVREVPDRFRKVLPSDAVPVPEAPKPTVPEAPRLRDFDLDRAAAEAEGKIVANAELERLKGKGASK